MVYEIKKLLFGVAEVLFRRSQRFIKINPD